MNNPINHAGLCNGDITVDYTVSSTVSAPM